MFSKKKILFFRPPFPAQYFAALVILTCKNFISKEGYFNKGKIQNKNQQVERRKFSQCFKFSNSCKVGDEYLWCRWSKKRHKTFFVSIMTVLKQSQTRHRICTADCFRQQKCLNQPSLEDAWRFSILAVDCSYISRGNKDFFWLQSNNDV